ITEKINKVNQELDSLRRDQTILEEKTKNDLEIKDLEFELSKNTRLYESNLKIIDLCETFTKIKAELLEESINANFKIVNFKLFNELVNGGVEETCTATVDGVPFATVNNANRINAGLDIINALQTIYGVSAPIFIDNAEAVVEFLNNDAQLIKLYVSAEDKQLRIEKENSDEI
ncbi:MAG TPA: ATPase, partial [Haploplasma sp.]|nr:ATPase [Haploplasma sp.]